MKNKLFKVLLGLALLLMAACKNPPIGIESFKIIDEKIDAEAYGAKVTGVFSFEGKIREMKMNVGLDESLTDAVEYVVDLNDHTFSEEIDSLNPNTIYYYNYGIDFGGKEDYLTEVNSFTTLQGPPLVKTVDAVAITALSYQVKCEVISDGGADIIERGIYWDTYGDPDMNDHIVRCAENGVGEYICIMDSLAPNTTYFARAYARNALGTGVGDTIRISTGNGSEVPEVRTLEVLDVTAISARCGGEVINNGGAFSISSRGVCWSTAPVPTIDDDHTVDGNGFGAFVSNVTNLASNTTYNIRAYAIVNDQNNTIAIDTVYGEIKSFTTLNGVEPNTPVTVAVIADPTIIPKGGNSQLKASASGGDGNYSYSWTPAASLDNPNVQSPIASPEETTTYTCTVTSDNTTASSSCTITVVKAPTNLIAEVQDGNDVQLTWTNADPAQTYKIYRNNTFLEQIAFTTYEDNNLSPGIYKYQVATLYGEVESPKSDSVIVEITSQIPEGALEHLFTVGFNNKQIWFSNGNLQYQASTKTWRFADNQYNIMGSANSNISQNNNGWIDLFGWGTSGYRHGATCYQPWDTSEVDSNYYAYGNPSNNLNTLGGQADWGYNAIDNGGNEANMGWRTMTSSEWHYLLNQRQTSSNIRFAKAWVNGVSGLVILPDDWDASFYNLNNTNEIDSSYDSNNITEDNWTNLLEAHGAVFLPAGGRRRNIEFYNNGVGYYWSSNQNGESDAYYLLFNKRTLNAKESDGRHFGSMVRLVFDKP